MINIKIQSSHLSEMLKDVELNTSRINLSQQGLGDFTLEELSGLFSLFSIILPKLEYLDLSKNKLSVLPSNISHFSCLQTLLLDENQLEDLPISIKEMSELQFLSIQNNQIQKRPDFLYEMELRSVALSDNPFLKGKRQLSSKELDNIHQLLRHKNFDFVLQGIELWTLFVEDVSLEEFIEQIRKISGQTDITEGVTYFV